MSRRVIGPKRPQSKKRHLNVGRRLEGTIRLIQAERIQNQDTVRLWIVAAVIVTTTMFLIAAAIHGAATGSFAAVNAVWIAAGPLVGGILTHYFDRRER